MANESKVRIRESGIELLKIIAMVGIVLSHIIPTQGEFDVGVSHVGLYTFTASKSLQDFILLIFRNLGQLGNVIFIVCSAWFLSKSQKVRKEKIVYMVVDTFLLSIISLALFFIFGINLSFGNIIKLVFPLTFEIYWFISCYILMYAIHPLINIIIDKIDKKTHLAYSFIFVMIYMVIGFIIRDSFYFSQLVGFVGIYFIVAYFKKYMIKTVSNKKYSILTLFIGIIGWFGVNGITNLLGVHFGSLSDKIRYWNHIMNPFLFLVGFSLFNLFRQIKLSSKFINYISSLTLLVYIIHSNPFMLCYLKPKLFNHIYTTYTYEHIVLWVVLCGIVLFIVSAIIAVVYNKIIQPFVHFLARKILGIVLKIYSKIETGILKLD